MTLRSFWLRLTGGGADATPDTAAPVAQDPENLERLEVKLGHTFEDPSLLANALVHRSHIHVSQAARIESNERLEFLGDAVLGVVVNAYLYERFPEASEGDLTKMKSLLVCGSRLSEVAAQLDLGSHVQMSRAEAATGGRHRSSILADTTEALIGAIYLDGGLEAAEAMINRCLLVQCDQVLARRGLDNYKSRLQEMVQARYKSPPRYRVLSAEGPDHARVFTVCVTFNGTALGQGEGPNKKTAEQVAAHSALERLTREPDLLAELGGDGRGPAE